MRAVVYIVAAAATGLAISEVVMQPSSGERVELALIFVTMASLLAATARWVPYQARRNRSLRVTVELLSSLTIAVVTLVLVVVASRMFIEPHDLMLLLVVLGFGAITAIGFSVSVGRSLTADLDRLSRRAEEVTAGELNGPTNLDRADEIGKLSRSLDEMVDQLRRASIERDADAESRRRFFSAVGHDLRTPLASMRAAIEAMQDGVVEDTDRYLRAMERDVAALTSLVDDVFLLAKLDSESYEVDLVSIDVTEVADETLEVLKPLARERNVNLELLASDRVVALASAGPLARALRNLLDNAIRHAPTGSTVTVEVTSGTGTATVQVLDSGIGFEAEFLPVAFDRFTRSDQARERERGGSGLGLAIASELVGALDGRIWADPGPGGSVSVELPAGV